MHAIKTVFEKLPSKHLWSNLINKSRIVMAITIPLFTKLPWPEEREHLRSGSHKSQQSLRKKAASYLMQRQSHPIQRREKADSHGWQI